MAVVGYSLFGAESSRRGILPRPPSPLERGSRGVFRRSPFSICNGQFAILSLLPREGRGLRDRSSKTHQFMLPCVCHVAPPPLANVRISQGTPWFGCAERTRGKETSKLHARARRPRSRAAHSRTEFRRRAARATSHRRAVYRRRAARATSHRRATTNWVAATQFSWPQHHFSEKT